MDSPIRPIQDSPVSGPAPVHRRRKNDERPFDLERELAHGGRHRSKDDDREGPGPPENHHEDTPVAPPDEDEAGGRLDVTA